MKILILSYANVANTIGVTLMDYGHEVSWFGGGAFDDLTIAEMYSKHDGCLLLGEEPDLERLARYMRDLGKIVWRDWTDIPPTKEWPKGGYLASLQKP